MPNQYGPFRRSQLRDPEFYLKHQEAIDKAAAAGEIIDDTADRRTPTVNVTDQEFLTLSSLKYGDRLMYQPPGRSDWTKAKYCRVVLDEYRDGGRRLVLRPELDPGIADSIVDLSPEPIH